MPKRRGVAAVLRRRRHRRAHDAAPVRPRPTLAQRRRRGAGEHRVGVRHLEQEHLEVQRCGAAGVQQVASSKGGRSALLARSWRRQRQARSQDGRDAACSGAARGRRGGKQRAAEEEEGERHGGGESGALAPPQRRHRAAR
jgi:hypothetical protein